MTDSGSRFKYLVASDFLEELTGKIALVKSDFNVPFLENGSIADTFRIDQPSPFLRKLIDANVDIILASHLGRPEGYDPSLTLDVIVNPLSKAIGRDIEIIRYDDNNNCYDKKQLNRKYIQNLFKNKKVPLLDNLRFHPSESKNDGCLAKSLKNIIDVSIQNSFGTAHRMEDTSNYIHELVPGLAGDLFVTEVNEHLKIKEPISPYAVIVGGDKPEDSFNLMRDVIRADKTTHWSNLSRPYLNTKMKDKLVDHLLVGGHLLPAVIYAQLNMLKDTELDGLDGEVRRNLRGLKGEEFLKGYSYNEEEIRLAKGLIRLYNQYQFKSNDPLTYKDPKDEKVKGRRLIIPIDYTILRKGKLNESVKLHDLHYGDEIVSYGKETDQLYRSAIQKAKTIVWNGPMGSNEEKFPEREV